MDNPTYRFRPSLLRTELSYRLGDHALEWSDGRDEGSLAFSEVRQIRIYSSPGIGLLGGGSVAPAFQRCVIQPRRGRARVLSSNHFVGIGKFEDRSATFGPFVDALIQRVAANPTTVFLSGMPLALWVSWAAILVGVVIVTPLALLMITVSLFKGTGTPGPLLVTTAVLLGILASLLPLVRALRRNRPRRFDPRAPRA